MPDYKNGKIYKIVSDQTDKVYIGSTCQSIAQRFTEHKYNFLRYINQGKGNYTTSFDMLQFDDAKVILIELFPCTQKCELEAREYHHIKLNDIVVNKVMPTRTNKEWKESNMDTFNKYQKEYNIKNKEKIALYMKAYSAQYRQMNQPKIKDEKKTYYEKNKADIDAKCKIPFVCTCGCTIQLSEKARHLKTKKHLSKLSIIIDE